LQPRSVQAHLRITRRNRHTLTIGHFAPEVAE
jgi:hypothetical protein